MSRPAAPRPAAPRPAALRPGALDRCALDPGAPVVLVGQARSGSTLLTAMLNRAGPGFVMNDAYVMQAADAHRLDRGPAGRPAFAREMLARLAARSWDAAAAPPHRSLRLDAAGLARAAEAEAAAADWATGFAAMMCAAGRGARFWGWNTPPDHARIAEIRRLYPRARFVLLMRDPWRVLLSYKRLPAYWGAERARYHPAAQALAWRRAAAAADGPALLLRYEDLIAAPDAAFARLSAHLGVSMTAPELADFPPNGSARQGARLGRAEAWVAACVLGAAPARLGYAERPATEGLGAAALAAATARAAWFYASRAARSRDMRGRLRRMAWPGPA